MSAPQTKFQVIDVTRFEKTSECINSIFFINGREICRAYEAKDRHIPDGEYLAYAYQAKDFNNSHIRLIAKGYHNSKIVLGLPLYLMANVFCPCEEFSNSGGKYCMPAFKRLFKTLQLGQMYKFVIKSDFKV